MSTKKLVSEEKLVMEITKKQLKDLIHTEIPGARFDLYPGEAPNKWYLWVYFSPGEEKKLKAICAKKKLRCSSCHCSETYSMVRQIFLGKWVPT